MTRASIWVLALALCASAGASELNQLTEAEAKAGWKLLFDGKTSAGWQGPKGLPFPSQTWAIEDGLIQTRTDPSGGDVWSTERYENFELELDFKILPGGNSGVKYLVQPEWLSPHFLPTDGPVAKHHNSLSAVGPEYQIYDDPTLPKTPGWELSSTGGFYLLYAPENKKLHPAGEWNHLRILVDGMHVEHWLNGAKLLQYELGSDELLARVEKTKFRKVPGFGIKGPGYVVLQHHDHPAWFKNIKIRER